MTRLWLGFYKTPWFFGQALLRPLSSAQTGSCWALLSLAHTLDVRKINLKGKQALGCGSRAGGGGGQGWRGRRALMGGCGALRFLPALVTEQITHRSRCPGETCAGGDAGRGSGPGKPLRTLARTGRGLRTDPASPEEQRCTERSRSGDRQAALSKGWGEAALLGGGDPRLGGMQAGTSRT